MQFLLTPVAGMRLLWALLPVSGLAIALTPPTALAQSCTPSLVFAEPATALRTVNISSLQAAFEIPENYDIQYTYNGIAVVAPVAAELVSCVSEVGLGQGGQPGQISISLTREAVSEETIRAYLAETGGRYWGETRLPSGTGLMYTTSDARVHISLPTPDQQAAIVFTADMDSADNILREDVYETILESFRF